MNLRTVRIIGQLFFGFVICLLSSVAGAQADAVRPEVPQIVVSSPVFDFGVVDQGSVVKHEFVIENKGSVALEIKSVVPSCGCTVAEMTNRIISGGSSEKLVAEFDTSGFWGNKVKTIRVYTNDPHSPSFVITLQGEIRRDVVVTPPRVFFKDVSKGIGASQTLMIYTQVKSGIEVGEVTSKSGLVTINVEPVKDKKRTGKKVSIQLGKKLPIGDFRDLLIIKTTSPRNPVISVPIAAKIVGDWLPSVDILSFGFNEGPLVNPLQKTMHLLNGGTSSTAILSVVSDKSSILVDFKELIPNKDYEITVSIKPDFVGTIRGNIKITTDHPDDEQRVISVPVYGIVADKLSGDAAQGR